MEGISRLLGKCFIRDHTKLPILAVADDGGGDDTSENDDGIWCHCQIAKDGSMNHVLYVHVMPKDKKPQEQIVLF